MCWGQCLLNMLLELWNPKQQTNCWTWKHGTSCHSCHNSWFDSNWLQRSLSLAPLKIFVASNTVEHTIATKITLTLKLAHNKWQGFLQSCSTPSWSHRQRSHPRHLRHCEAGAHGELGLNPPIQDGEGGDGVGLVAAGRRERDVRPVVAVPREPPLAWCWRRRPGPPGSWRGRSRWCWRRRCQRRPRAAPSAAPPRRSPPGGSWGSPRRPWRTCSPPCRGWGWWGPPPRPRRSPRRSRPPRSSRSPSGTSPGPSLAGGCSWV